VLSGSSLGRPGGRPVGQSPGTVNRAVDQQAATVKNMTVAWSTARSIDRLFWPDVWPQRL